MRSCLVYQTLNIIFSVARYVRSQEPTHHKVGSKRHLTPRRFFLSRVGPTGSNSRRIAQRWLFVYLFIDENLMDDKASSLGHRQPWCPTATAMGDSSGPRPGSGWPTGPGLTPPTGHMAACGGGSDTAPFPTPSSPFILRGLCYIFEIDFRVYVGGVSVWESQVLEGGKIAHQAAVQGSWDGGTGAWFRITRRAVAVVPGPAPATPRWRGRWGERWWCPYTYKIKGQVLTWGIWVYMCVHQRFELFVVHLKLFERVNHVCRWFLC
jgi:hypothetical protein